MHIRNISIENIRCFKRVEVDLTHGQSTNTWCMILGENSVGKTTVLRCIGMGLCDSTSSAALQRELYGDWIRQGEQVGKIRIELSKRRNQRYYEISTSFEKSPGGYLTVKQDTYPTPFPWDDIFVCGYGAARRSFGTKDYDEYATLDAMYTLFNYDSPLQTPELVLRRIAFTDEDALSSTLKILNEILMLPKNSLKLKRTGLEIRGPWGRFVPFGALGDGYQATLAWLSDLLGWALLYDYKQVKRNINGIVLIDELEQHLHPKWQRLIVSLLSERFPKVQFIGTSHSALCASGMADLSKDRAQLMLLKVADQRVVQAYEMEVPVGLRADQILSSAAFGLETTRDPRTAEKLEQFAALFQKRTRSPAEEREFQNLRSWFRQNAPEAAESERERLIQRELRITLEKVKSAMQKQGKPEV